MIRLQLIIGVLAVIAGAPPVTAQTADIESANTQLWWQYSFQNRLSENWSFTWDSGYRDLWESTIPDDAWERFHLSSAFSYRLHSRLNLDLGSGLYYTTRPLSSDLTEFRLWQGTTVYWPDSPGLVRRFVLAHRLRLEQRLSRQSGTSSWTMNSRARYRMSTTVAINRKDLEPGAFYLYLGAEFFADLSDDDSRLVSDRNRFSIGLGWLTTTKWTLELRYSSQENRDTATGNFRLTDEIVEIRVKTTLRIRDRMKAH